MAGAEKVIRWPQGETVFMRFNTGMSTGSEPGAKHLSRPERKDGRWIRIARLSVRAEPQKEKRSYLQALHIYETRVNILTSPIKTTSEGKMSLFGKRICADVGVLNSARLLHGSGNGLCAVPRAKTRRWLTCSGLELGWRRN